MLGASVRLASQAQCCIACVYSLCDECLQQVDRVRVLPKNDLVRAICTQCIGSEQE